MIAVAGESLVDLIVHDDDELRAYPGGGPYNVARTVARLGRPCCYVGALSSDPFGRQLRAELLSSGVSDTWAPLTDRPTTLALARIGPAGDASYTFYVDGTSAAGLSPDEALAVLAAGPGVICVGTLGLVLEPAASSLETLVHAAGADVLVAVDPNCRPAAIRDEAAFRERLGRIMQRADLVKVSRDDLAYLVPGADPAAGAVALRGMGARIVLVTDGPREVLVVGDGWQRTVAVPVTPVTDTVGAGDAFLGAVLARLDATGSGRSSCDDPDEVVAAVRLGVGVSAITVGRRGADPPSRPELPSELAALLEPDG